MGPQNESLNEKAKRIEISLKYTNGDMDKAKLMSSGKLQDVVVIKGKFAVPEKNSSGLILGFVNVLGEYISSIRIVMSANTRIYSSVRVFDSWKALYKNLVAYEAADDSMNSGKLVSDLLTSFIETDIFPDAQNKNLDFLSVSIQDMIKKSLGSDKVKSQFDIDMASSLDLELAGVEIMLPGSTETPAVQETADSAPQKPKSDSPFQKKLDAIEANATYIIEAVCVLSPVKGKHISEIESGERILVVLSAKDSMSDRIIDAYKARGEDGQPLPIVGRVIEKVPNEEGRGYIIYTLVAKGIYAKVIEEESVKIQTELTKAIMEGNEEESEDPYKNKVFNFLIYGLFILLIIAIIVILISL
ncbi:MAG TPA: hypothetical protein PK514_13755 [Spirochaetota bacterium]|nr:hypothetical protein [Spirochaetota bacterium]